MTSIKLFKCLPGQGLSDFTKKFEDLYKKNPFNAVLVVPTSRMKKDLIRKFENSNIPVAKTSIITLRECAEIIFTGSSPNKIFINSEDAELIISQIIQENAAEVPLFFPNNQISPRIIRELKKFISTLINRKTDYPRSLDKLQNEKSRQLTLIYKKYLSYLGDNNLIDEDLLLVEVINTIDSKTNPFDTIFIYGIYEPLPLERDFIKKISVRAIHFHYALPWSNNSLIFKDQGDWLGIPDPVQITPDTSSSELATLFTDNGKKDLSQKIFLSCFMDRISEMRGVAQEIRNIRDLGADLGKIVVAFPDRDRGAVIASVVFQDFGIPFNIRTADILSQSPIVQTILDLIEIPASNYKREDVVRLLKSPYIHFSWIVNGERKWLWGHEVDFESRAANITEGKSSWSVALKSLYDDLEAEMALPETPAGKRDVYSHRLARVEKISSGLLAMFQDLGALEGERPIRDHIGILRSILKKWEFKKYTQYPEEEIYRRDSRALREFFSVLDSMEKGHLIIPEENMGLEEFFISLSMVISDRRYSGKDENQNTVQITGFRELVHLKYDYLFVVNLIDGEIPRTNLGQPFTTELEIESMGFLTRRDLLRQERYYFLSTLLTAQKKIYLSYPESEKDQPVVPSCFINDIQQSFETGTWGDQPQISSKFTCQYSEGKAISNGNFENIILTNNPPLTITNIVDRINIENYYRKRDYSSPFDGILLDDEEITEKLGELFSEKRIYSPSRFEIYGLCPFSFFLKYVLYLDVMPDIEIEISPKERGILFHRIAFRFYTDRKNDGCSKVSVEELPRAIEEIKKIAVEEFQKFSFNDPVWNAFKERYLGSGDGRLGLLEGFLQNESLDTPSSFSPVHFELSLGSRKVPGTMDEASSEDPVEIDLGDGDPASVLIRGKIDRLDTTEQNQFIVVDYKTGGTSDSYKNIENGLSFQLPLYLLCIEQKYPEMTGIAGIHYIIKNSQDIAKKIIIGDKSNKDLFDELGRSHGVRDDYRDILEYSLSFVKQYIQQMRSGIFHPTKLYNKCPSYCEYRWICRFDTLRLLESTEAAHGTD